MRKVKPKKDNHNKSMISYEIYHEENPHNRVLGKPKGSKIYSKVTKKDK